MSENEKKTPEKKPEHKNNTMDIKLINSTGDKIKMSGSCTDKEIKAICRAISHSSEQKVEIK